MSAAAKMEACQEQRQSRGSAGAAAAATARRRLLQSAGSARSLSSAAPPSASLCTGEGDGRTDRRAPAASPPPHLLLPSSAACFAVSPSLPLRSAQLPPPSRTAPFHGAFDAAQVPPPFLPHFGVAQGRETWRVLCTRGVLIRSGSGKLFLAHGTRRIFLWLREGGGGESRGGREGKGTFVISRGARMNGVAI